MQTPLVIFCCCRLVLIKTLNYLHFHISFLIRIFIDFFIRFKTDSQPTEDEEKLSKDVGTRRKRQRKVSKLSHGRQKSDKTG
jgi:ABC-type multidrug transport system ATPase subunit